MGHFMSSSVIEKNEKILAVWPVLGDISVWDPFLEGPSGPIKTLSQKSPSRSDPKNSDNVDIFALLVPPLMSITAGFIAAAPAALDFLVARSAFAYSKIPEDKRRKRTDNEESEPGKKRKIEYGNEDTKKRKREEEEQGTRTRDCHKKSKGDREGKPRAGGG